MTSKQILTEWKYFGDVPIIKGNYDSDRLDYNSFLGIPSQMGIEFSLKDEKISHPYTKNSVLYHSRRWINGKFIKSEPFFSVWDGNNWTEKTLEFVFENYKVRPDSKDAKNYNKWIDNIALNDFVRFQGQRNSNIWKKIVHITENTLMCHQYYKPIDEINYFSGYSSETLIWKIKEKYENQ